MSKPDIDTHLRRSTALAIYGVDSILQLPSNWETDSRISRVVALLQEENIKSSIAELKRAKLQSYIQAPQMHKVNRRIEQLEAELRKGSKHE